MEVQILRICFDSKEWLRDQRLSFSIIKEIRLVVEAKQVLKIYEFLISNYSDFFSPPAKSLFT